MKTFLYTLLCCFLLAACGSSFEPVTECPSELSGIQGVAGSPVGPPGPPILNPSGSITLGKKLDNPYTVAAMKTAFYSVVIKTQTGPSGPQGPVGP